MKKPRTTDDDVLWNGFSLLQDTGFNVHEDSVSEDIDDSESSNNSADMSIGNQGFDNEELHTFNDAELVELEHGYEAHLFYACVEALPHGVYMDSSPLVHAGRIFQQIVY
jgi:hypothetical protein